MNKLFFIPIRSNNVTWEEHNREVVLVVKNQGIFNLIFRFLLNKPKTSRIHLDETGSYIWKQIDGKKTIFEIGAELEKEFSDVVYPVYERLVKFFYILKENKLIIFSKK